MKLVGIPHVNGLGKTKGVEEAPEKVFKALEEVYSGFSGKSFDYRKISFEKISLGEDLLKDSKKIYDFARKRFGKERLVFVGGDHSASFPLVRAFKDFVEGKRREPALIVFDAHPDMMNPVDNEIPTHEEWLRALIEEGFNPKNILLVGVRNIYEDEQKFMGDKIRKVSVEELLFELENKTDAIMEFANGKDLYVSIDIDFVDPAFAPGTGYCEPGGVSSAQALYIFKRIAMMKNLVAVDVMEINPSKDVRGLTVALGAKIISGFFTP